MCAIIFLDILLTYSLFSYIYFFRPHLGKEDDRKVLKESLGNSTEFLNSVTQILKDDSSPVQDLSSAAAQLSPQVARCDYEHGTSWGTKVREALSFLLPH